MMLLPIGGDWAAESPSKGKEAVLALREVRRQTVIAADGRAFDVIEVVETAGKNGR